MDYIYAGGQSDCKVWACGFRFYLNCSRRRWSGWRRHVVFLGHRRNIDRVDDGTNNVVVVAVAEDPVEEHGQPHSPLRDPPRHDGQPRLEVVVCKAMAISHSSISISSHFDSEIRGRVIRSSERTYYRIGFPLRGRRCRPTCTPSLCSPWRTCCTSMLSTCNASSTSSAKKCIFRSFYIYFQLIKKILPE